MALRQPESLQKLARNFIRRDLLGPDGEALIHSLPLPEALKLYINFGFHYELPDEMLPPEPEQSWSLNQLVEATAQLLALSCDNMALGKPKRAKANLNKVLLCQPTKSSANDRIENVAPSFISPKEQKGKEKKQRK
eukprot:m.131751 g.131751  ORF g.131751 m.131751 type:complete len:136 (-) comp16826_c1_seq6:41-448(-)